MNTKPKSTHPWRLAPNNAKRLKEARKERKRIYERSSFRVDEYYKLRQNDAYRKKRGLPLDTPKMKPWDYVKGRVGPT